MTGPAGELLRLALNHYEMREYEAAEHALQRLIALEPDLEKAWFLMGAIEFERGSKEKAQQHLNKTTNSWLLWLRLGLQIEGQDPERALACFEMTLRESPLNNHALYYKGLMLQKIGRHKESCESFRLLSPFRELFSRVFIPLGFMALLGAGAVMLFSRGETGLSLVTLISSAFCVFWLQRDAGAAIGMFRKWISCRRSQ